MRWKACDGCNIDGTCSNQKSGSGCKAVERTKQQDRTEIVIVKKYGKYDVTIGNQYTDGIKKTCKNSQDAVNFIKSYLDYKADKQDAVVCIN